MDSSFTDTNRLWSIHTYNGLIIYKYTDCGLYILTMDSSFTNTNRLWSIHTYNGLIIYKYTQIVVYTYLQWIHHLQIHRLWSIHTYNGFIIYKYTQIVIYTYLQWIHHLQIHTDSGLYILTMYSSFTNTNRFWSIYGAFHSNWAIKISKWNYEIFQYKCIVLSHKYQNARKLQFSDFGTLLSYHKLAYISCDTGITVTEGKIKK